mgnify:CR=1 FL=1
MLTLDRRNSSLTPDAADSGEVNNWFPQNRTRMFAPLQEAEVRADAPISLRAYVDGSVIEIFVNERVALTGLVFPVLEDSVHLRVDEGIAALSVWQLESTSPVIAKPTPDHFKSDDDGNALLGHVGTGSLKYLTWYNAPGDGDWLTQTHSNLLTNENLDHMMGKYTDANNDTFDPFFMLDLHQEQEWNSNPVPLTFAWRYASWTASASASGTVVSLSPWNSIIGAAVGP